jgi:hypothetical protein
VNEGAVAAGPSEATPEVDADYRNRWGGERKARWPYRRAFHRPNASHSPFNEMREREAGTAGPGVEGIAGTAAISADALRVLRKLRRSIMSPVNSLRRPPCWEEQLLHELLENRLVGGIGTSLLFRSLHMQPERLDFKRMRRSN